MQKLEPDSSPHPTPRWPPKKLREARDVYRQSGFKGVIKHLGWKVLALLFAYYLVRDVSIYIILPWYIANKLTN